MHQLASSSSSSSEWTPLFSRIFSYVLCIGFDHSVDICISLFSSFFEERERENTGIILQKTHEWRGEITCDLWREMEREWVGQLEVSSILVGEERGCPGYNLISRSLELTRFCLLGGGDWEKIIKKVNLLHWDYWNLLKISKLQYIGARLLWHWKKTKNLIVGELHWDAGYRKLILTSIQICPSVDPCVRNGPKPFCLCVL